MLRIRAAVTAAIVLGHCIGCHAMPKEETVRYLSHPPVRVAPPPSRRAPAEGPAFFVDPAKGADANAGTKDAPWRTINHALSQLKPGDTLYLRGGSYFENVYCAAAGKKDAPITIRSYPGEQAVLDGGFPEFQTDPAGAWQPYDGPDAAPGEFVSTRVYRNIRDVVGRFGDSNIGLQTYWHAMDLRAENELWIRDPEKKIMVLPVYCGPGIWYDKLSGRIHVRLKHTNIRNPLVPNYRGETDPRNLPLVIAPFAAVPLRVDQAMHVRFQDLVIRGGGHNAVVTEFGVGIEFDNVTIFAGTYGLRSVGTGPMRFADSAIYGMCAPWAFRTENGLHTYSPDYYDPFLNEYLEKPANVRNVARLMTHALLVTEGGFEFEVFYYPHNHHWEIVHSEFTEGHDGVYLSGKHIRFHHNWVDNIQDDGIYMSGPVPHFADDIHIYQNIITRCLMAFSCHSRGGPEGKTYIYRNIVDFRQGVNADRPTPEKPAGELKNYHVYLMHGRPFLGVESLHFYQNTLVCPAHVDGYLHRMLYNTSEITQRRVFNNICVYLNTYRPASLRAGMEKMDIQADGNLHWCPVPGAEPPKDYLERVRHSAVSKANQAKYPPGWEANSFVADPKFAAFGMAQDAKNDYRLQDGSPAIGTGIVLPETLEDPLRPKDGARPDIGALPFGAPPLRVGRNGRITFPLSDAAR